MNVRNKFGKAPSGWWWAVWQDDRLVGFGAGYKDKRRCFSHEKKCLKLAGKALMFPVECTNPIIPKSPQEGPAHD